jgi:hypothetical protein
MRESFSRGTMNTYEASPERVDLGWGKLRLANGTARFSREEESHER